MSWNQRRAADRPAKNAKRDYDRSNAEAAGLILASPQTYGEFMVDWAKRFRQRRADEKLSQTVDKGLA